MEPLSVDKFRKMPGLKVVCYNVRSLFHKIDPVSIHLLDGINSVVCIQETWLDSRVPNGYLKNNSYNIYRQDRSYFSEVNGELKKGGGLLVYVKKDVTVNSLMFNKCNVNTKDLEMMCLEISPKNYKKINLIVLYRPPSGDVSTSLEYLKYALQEVRKNSNRDVILMGDFNINIIDDTNTKTQELFSVTEPFKLNCEIRCVTREESSTGIDLVFSKAKNIAECGTLCLNYSDHLPIYLLKQKIHERSSKCIFEGRWYKNYDFDSFKNIVTRFNWPVIKEDSDPDAVWDNMYQVIKQSTDLLCPYRTFVKKRSHLPYIDDEILYLEAERDRAIDRAKKTKIREDWVLANRMRKLVMQKYKYCKQNYVLNKLRENEKDTNKFWSIVREIIPGEVSNEINSVIDETKNETVYNKEAACYINNYYCTIGEKLDKQVQDPSFETPIHYTESVLDWNQELSEEEVKKEVLNLNITKASGLMEVNTRILKDSLLIFISLFTCLLNLCIKKGKFPTKWKVGITVPIPKADDSSYVTNLRPITLTPLTGKILETFMCKKIRKFLNDKNILMQEQHGFRERHSTTSAIYEVLKYAYEALDRKEFCLMTMFDLSKAFDSLNRDKLLMKLFNIGIRGTFLELIGSYFTDRMQRVRLGKFYSDLKQVEYGIGQGTCLGPLMFLIYVNDLNLLNLASKIITYADDTIFLVSGKDLRQLFSIMQDDINIFFNWSCSNRLSINSKKTKYMLCHNVSDKHYISNILSQDNTLNLYLRGDCLGKVTEYPYLGFQLQENMDPSTHIKYILRKANHKLYLLQRLRYFLNDFASLTVYKTHVLSILEYGLVFCQSVNKNLFDKMQKLQNRALRICLRKDRYTSNYQIHKDSKLLPLSERIELTTLRLMYERVINRCDDVIFPEENHLRILPRNRKVAFIHQNRYVSKKYKKSIFFKGPRLWNEQPLYIKEINRKPMFIQHVKKRIAKKYNDVNS